MSLPADRPRPPVTHRVFLSSTSVDLETYRTRIARLLEESFQQFAVTMDRFPERPLGTVDASDVSVEEVQQCNLFLLLVAWRYGYIPTSPTAHDLSVTHQEYREARRLGLPCFVFLADPTTEADSRETARYPASVRNLDKQLQAFRHELETPPNIVKYFTSVDDLVNKVVAAFYHYLGKPPPESSPVPHNLPPRVPGFVGREQELTTLTEALLKGQSTGLSPLVNGMGGIGKSALAAEVVRRLAQDPSAFPSGISWVRCDGRTGLGGLTWVYDQLLDTWHAPLAPEVAAQTITPEAALALREQQMQRVFGSLPSQTVLLLLDNVERGFPLPRALDTLTALPITVFLTARHRPASGRLRSVSLEVLAPQAAVALFYERYTAQGGDWQPARDQEPTLPVAEQLGYLPLAIELAAARAALTHLTVAGLAAELTEARRLGYLTDPTNSEKPEGSVRYSLLKSLDTLTAHQRLRFAAFGLLHGADWPADLILAFLDGVTLLPPEDVTTLPASAPVAAPPANSTQEELVLFAALSLLALLAPSSGQRVRVHALLRDLARDEWQRLSRATPVLQEMGIVALMAATAEFIEQHKQQFGVLASAEETLVGALQTAAAFPPAYQSYVQAIASLFSYIYTGGHWRLGQILSTQQLTICRERGDREGEGVTLNNLGLLADSLGQKEQARQYYEQALPIFKEIGDRRGEGATLSNLGSLAKSLGQKEQARQYYEQALPIQQAIGDRAGEGTTLNNLGLLAYSLGQYDEAHRYYEQALGILTAIGAVVEARTVANNLKELTAEQTEAKKRQWPWHRQKR